MGHRLAVGGRWTRQDSALALSFQCLMGLLGMFHGLRCDNLCRWSVGVVKGWKGVYAGVVGILFNGRGFACPFLLWWVCGLGCE